jgi:hypothetical protein
MSGGAAAGGATAGGAAVGHLADLDAIEAAAVMCLRLWPGAGVPAGPFGGAGREALAAVAALCRHAVDHARLPILRHSPTCPCIGADEACFARMISAATAGDREDAMLIAVLMVRADAAPGLAALAEAAGLVLKRMTLRSGRLH